MADIPRRIGLVAILLGLVITLLTGLISGTPHGLVGATLYGLPLAWRYISPSALLTTFSIPHFIVDWIFWSVVIGNVRTLRGKKKEE